MLQQLPTQTLAVSEAASTQRKQMYYRELHCVQQFRFYPEFLFRCEHKYVVFINENNLPVHRKTRDNNMENVEVLNNLLPSVFTGCYSSHISKALNLKTGTERTKSHLL